MSKLTAIIIIVVVLVPCFVLYGRALVNWHPRKPLK